ncbi:MAG: LytTR family transcriptional regulator [Lachnospiraceae bacterium]|nr:LytTR family transcriptional regulator [Lachnospiraceae bacterium]
MESQKNQHKLLVHMRSEVFTIAVALKEIEKQLGNDFILCRRGCLINPLHIVSAVPASREIIFDNKERCRCPAK